MPETLLPSPVWTLGRVLTGAENQNLRRLVRRSRQSLSAIDTSSPSSPSLLRMVIPLGMSSPSVRHGLLSLTNCISKRTEVDLYHYQMALSKLCADINDVKALNMDVDAVHRLLASSLLLHLASIPQCDGYWAQHIRGMISVVRLSDQPALFSTQLGRFLVSACALHDISAFAIGREQGSQSAWVSWMLSRGSPGNAGTLTHLETMVGHPESLISIIAQVCELTNDNIKMAYRSGPPGFWPPTPPCTLPVDLNPADKVESSLHQWQLPIISNAMSPIAKLALRIAWETLRKAALLYLWRGYGFETDLLRPIRPDRQNQSEAYVDEILNNIQGILELARIHGLSIGNAMLWPLTVAGCECGMGPAGRGKQLEGLLDDVAQLYQLEHVLRLKAVLNKLWATIRDTNIQAAEAYPPPWISLESVAREMNVVISLV